jgi:hypothetical protein
MSENTPRKKRSSALLEESSAKLVKTAPKKQAKMSNRSRPAIMRAGRAEKPSRYKPGSKSITSSNLQAMVTANNSPAVVRRKLKNDNGLVLEKTAFRLTVRETGPTTRMQVARQRSGGSPKGCGRPCSPHARGSVSFPANGMSSLLTQLIRCPSHSAPRQADEHQQKGHGLRQAHAYDVSGPGRSFQQVLK